MGAPRRVDLTRTTGPVSVPPGSVDFQLFSYQVPNDITDGIVASYGWDVSPIGGALVVTFSMWVAEAQQADYTQAQSQQGTIPIPYTCRKPLIPGCRVRVTVSNPDTTNAYDCNARLVLEF